MDKQILYRELTDSLSALLAGEYDFIASLANTSALLFERLENINWAGFYLRDGQQLVLGPFQVKLPVSEFLLVKGYVEAHSQKIRSSGLPTCMNSLIISLVMRQVTLKLCCL